MASRLQEQVTEPLLESTDDVSASRPDGAPPRQQLGFKAEARRVLALALPITASQVLGFLAHLITTAQVGHLGSLQLSALTLGRSVFHITGLSLVTGLASGVSTLGGQAYGAGHASLVAAVTQRALLLNLALGVLVLVGWTQLTVIMDWLGQDPAIAQLAAQFIKWLSPTLIMDAMLSCLHNHLACQGIVRPLTAIATACTIITPGINYLFIHVMDLGLLGVAAAMNIITLIDLSLAAAVVYWVDPPSNPHLEHDHADPDGLPDQTAHPASSDHASHGQAVPTEAKLSSSGDVGVAQSGDLGTTNHAAEGYGRTTESLQEEGAALDDELRSLSGHGGGLPVLRTASGEDAVAVAVREGLLASGLRTTHGEGAVAAAVLRTSMRHWAWSWGGTLSVKGCGQYLRVALPSLAMICADWWCFEAIILVAGEQATAGTQLAVMGILFYTHTLVFFLNEGFTGAAATRLSNLLGAGKAQQARYTMGVCVLLASVTSATCAAVLMLGKRPWASLFTSDPQVLSSTTAALPWMALSLVGDGCNSVFTGVLEGAGRQALGFGANLIAFWLVGLPLAAWWGKSLGAKGMWMAMAAVSGLQACVLSLAVLSFDWQREAERASHNVRQGHSLLQGSPVQVADGNAKQGEV